MLQCSRPRVRPLVSTSRLARELCRFAGPGAALRCHGYVTAVAITPGYGELHNWLDPLLGHLDIDLGDPHGEAITNPLTRLYNALIAQLAVPGGFEIPGSLDPTSITTWCGAFLVAADADSAWGEDRSAFEKLLPLAVLAGRHPAHLLPADHPLAGAPVDSVLAAFRAGLPATVRSLKAHWGHYRPSRLEMNELVIWPERV